MDDLIKQIEDKTGLSAEKVLEVVTMVTDFFKANLPEELVNQVTSSLSQAAAAASNTASSAGGSAASRAQELAAGAAGMASSMLSKAMEAVTEMMPKPDADETDPEV